MKGSSKATLVQVRKQRRQVERPSGAPSGQPPLLRALFKVSLCSTAEGTQYAATHVHPPNHTRTVCAWALTAFLPPEQATADVYAEGEAPGPSSVSSAVSSAHGPTSRRRRWNRGRAAAAANACAGQGARRPPQEVPQVQPLGRRQGGSTSSSRWAPCTHGTGVGGRGTAVPLAWHAACRWDGALRAR